MEESRLCELLFCLFISCMGRECGREDVDVVDGGLGAGKTLLVSMDLVRLTWGIWTIVTVFWVRVGWAGKVRWSGVGLCEGLSAFVDWLRRSVDELLYIMYFVLTSLCAVLA